MSNGSQVIESYGSGYWRYNAALVMRTEGTRSLRCNIPDQRIGL